MWMMMMMIHQNRVHKYDLHLVKPRLASPMVSPIVLCMSVNDRGWRWWMVVRLVTASHHVPTITVKRGRLI